MLHIESKPDIGAAAHVQFVFEFDTNAMPTPFPSPVHVPEETSLLSFSSPRAPPEPVVDRLYSSRAPPAWLI